MTTREDAVAHEDDAAAERGPRAPWWRRLLGSHVFWGVLLLALAAPWFASGNGMDFLPFLLTLVGGWFLGSAFVNATTEIESRGRAALVHAIGAVVVGGLMASGITWGLGLTRLLPDPLGAVLFELYFAAIPAAGWIWLGLFARIGDLLQKPASAQPRPPEWKSGGGEGAVVRFPGVPIPMRRLNGIIAGSVFAGGAVAAVILILLGDVVLNLGPRLMIVLFGLAIGLPIYSVVSARLRRGTVPCAVRFGGRRLWIEVGDERHVLDVADLDLLAWRCGSDYARVEARGRGMDVSIIAGIAKTEKGMAADLPPLSRRMTRVLEANGLVSESSRRDGLTIFRRPRPTP